MTRVRGRYIFIVVPAAFKRPRVVRKNDLPAGYAARWYFAGRPSGEAEATVAAFEGYNRLVAMPPQQQPGWLQNIQNSENRLTTVVVPTADQVKRWLAEDSEAKGVKGAKAKGGKAKASGAKAKQAKAKAN